MLDGGGVARAVDDLAVETPVVEPVDVFQGGELDVGEGLPWSVRVDEFPLVQAVERFDERVVGRVAS